MSPRHNRRAELPPAPPPSGAGPSVRERFGGEDFEVRAVPGERATKTYRCPGCDHEVRPGTPHVVAWPADGDGSERRHWHRPCWAARDRRR